jgi:hypothetical protein
MRVGVAIDDVWDFFHDIYAELVGHHETALFQRRTYSLPIFRSRVSRYLLHSDMRTFLRRNDVVFFEWASDLLALASHQPKTCGIVTRMHRYDIYKWMDQVDWNAIDRIILVSRAKQKEFVLRFPKQAEKTVVIPVAISLKKFHPCIKPFKGNLDIL